jgi:ribosomal protein S18 acetylase RimI-like enzyme
MDMKLTYFKRYRMELDLRHPRPAAELPPGYYWLPWSESLLEVHAEVKYLAFRGEMDALVFPSLADRPGCRELMNAIRDRVGFCPAATWLVAGRDGCVGTVQGIVDEQGHGGIQNLGVMAAYRGKGIGRALLLKALVGFVAAGLRRAFLEVTARNESAVRMYRQLGFRCYKTVYRAVSLPEPEPAPIAVDPTPAGLGL